MKKDKTDTGDTATATAVTTEKRRGRVPGSRVESLDFRAYKALKRVNFEGFFERMNDSGDDPDQWRDDMINSIISTLRDKDIF